MSLNLYDLLDVDESASADEIRAAWKAAIAELDPTDRRFRAYNDAAGVLLDEQKRTAYDEELAALRAEDEPEQPDIEPVASESEHEVEPASEVEPDETTTEVPEGVADEDATGEPLAAPPEASALPRTSNGPGWWTIGAAAVAAVLAVVLAVWTLSQPDVRPAAEQASRAEAADSVVQTLVADKVVPALSMDYRHLDQNLKDLQALMTPEMAAKEAKSWGLLEQQAKQQHAVIVATAPNTGLTRVSEDATKAVVMAFIDQHVQKTGVAASVLKMWVTFVLDKDSSTGDWLVSDICTDKTCD